MSQTVYIVVRENNPADDPAVFESRLSALNCAILSMSEKDREEIEDEDEAEEEYDDLVNSTDDPWLVVSADLI